MSRPAPVAPAPSAASQAEAHTQPTASSPPPSVPSAKRTLTQGRPVLIQVVAMVGHGVNDAPALASADIGIAIGSGSDVAQEAGDLLLLGNDLHAVVIAIGLSRATMCKIRQNLLWAFLCNSLGVPIAALGWLNPMTTDAAMALSSLSVTVNSSLLRGYRGPEAKLEEF